MNFLQQNRALADAVAAIQQQAAAAASAATSPRPSTGTIPVDPAPSRLELAARMQQHALLQQQQLQQQAQQQVRPNLSTSTSHDCVLLPPSLFNSRWQFF